jgi:hypothetical protein
MSLYLIIIHLNVVLSSSLVPVQSLDLKPMQVLFKQQPAITSLQTQVLQFNKIQFQTIYINSLPNRGVSISNTNQSQSPNKNQPTTSTNQPDTSTANLPQSSNTNRSNNSTKNSQQSSAIYSALITGVVVLLVGILTFLYNRATLAESKRKERRESITKKLNEFYGPLDSYLKIIYEFNLILKTNKPSDFRTLTHLLDSSRIYENGMQVNLTNSDKKIIAEIIDIENKIEELVTSKGGLIDEPSQGSLLAKAIAHFRVLRLAFNEEISGEVERFEKFVYPRELDKTVQDKIQGLQQQLRETSTPGWIENLLKL